MRERIAVLVVVLVVAGAGGGALYLLLSRTERDLAAEAGEVFDAYLEAWRTWDTAAMVAMTDADPAEFSAAHGQMREALGVDDVTLGRGDVVREGAQAEVDVDVTLEPSYSTPFSWETRLVATVEDGSWTIHWSPETIHPRLRPGFRFEVESTPGGRAAILGHDGEPLSGTGRQHIIGIEPRRLDAERFRQALESSLPEALDDLDRLLARTDLVPTWFYPLVTLRPERFDAVWDAFRPIDGVLVRTEEGRLPLEDGFARHVIGRVGELTAEDLERLGPPYEPGDTGGLYGLERVFEDVLVGGEGVEIRIVESDGEVSTVLHEYAGDPPTDVETTLDADVQRAVERAVLGVDAVGVVVLDADSGAIRASASRSLGAYNRAWEGRYRLGGVAGLVPDADAVTSWEPDLPLPAFGGAFADRAVAETSVLHAASLVAAAHSGFWHAPYLLTSDGPADAVSLPDASDLRDALLASTAEALPPDEEEPRLFGLSTSAPAAGGGAPHAWFVGVRDGLAIAVLVENGNDGRTVAAPVALRFLRELEALREG